MDVHWNFESHSSPHQCHRYLEGHQLEDIYEHTDRLVQPFQWMLAIVALKGGLFPTHDEWKREPPNCIAFWDRMY